MLSSTGKQETSGCNLLPFSLFSKLGSCATAWRAEPAHPVATAALVLTREQAKTLLGTVGREGWSCLGFRIVYGALPGNAVELYRQLRVWSDGRDAIMLRVARAIPAVTAPWAPPLAAYLTLQLPTSAKGGGGGTVLSGERRKTRPFPWQQWARESALASAPPRQWCL